MLPIPHAQPIAGRVSFFPRLALSVIAIIAFAATAFAGDWQGSETTVDGQLVVQNPSAPMNAASELKLEELWRIGGFDDDEIFGVITSLFLADNGEIFMLDAQLNEVKVYSEDGEFLRSIGRAGEGPGEFRFAFGHFEVPGGNVGVLQAFPPKIVMLTPEGDPAGEYPIPEHTGSGFQIIISAQGAGENLAMMQMVNEQTGGGAGFLRKEVLTLVPYNSSAGVDVTSKSTELNLGNPVIDEIGWTGMINGRWGAFADGRVVACKSFEDYEIEVYNADGSLDRLIRMDYEPRKRSADEKAFTLDVFEKSTGRQLPLPNKRFEISDFFPSVGPIQTRDDGSLWVLSSNGQHGAEEGTMGVYDVFDAKGRFAQQFTLVGSEGIDMTDDLVIMEGDNLFVITDFLPSIVALQGGGGAGEEEEEDEDTEPMQIICYRLDAPKLGLN
jgi:hypothetical protein